jgi:hypothetical protein
MNDRISQKIPNNNIWHFSNSTSCRVQIDIVTTSRTDMSKVFCGFHDIS